ATVLVEVGEPRLLSAGLDQMHPAERARHTHGRGGKALDELGLRRSPKAAARPAAEVLLRAVANLAGPRTVSITHIGGEHAAARLLRRDARRRRRSPPPGGPAPGGGWRARGARTHRRALR